MATPVYGYSATLGANSVTIGGKLFTAPDLQYSGSSTQQFINSQEPGFRNTYYFTGQANSTGLLYYTLNSTQQYFVSTNANLVANQVVPVSFTLPANLPSPFNCYLLGTLIATASGETPVEALRVGDLVLTASGALRPIRWIGTGRVRQEWLESLDPQRVPVRIRAGALGGDAHSGLTPRRDLLVTHNHGMVVDGALIPAAWLRNGVSIISEIGTTAWDYVHIELDSHDILLAEGAASESYRPCGNRAIFDNAATAPGQNDEGETLPCLPIILAGPILEEARQMIIARCRVLEAAEVAA